MSTLAQGEEGGTTLSSPPTFYFYIAKMVQKKQVPHPPSFPPLLLDRGTKTTSAVSQRLQYLIAVSWGEVGTRLLIPASF